VLFANTLLSLDVSTYDMRSFLLGQSPFKDVRTKPFTGGGGDPNKQAGSKVQERRDFDPLAFWSPNLRTGSNGTVKVRFKLPDTVTAYRVYAVAVDKGARYGSGEVAKKVVKPFYLEPGLPRFMVRGDSMTFPVALFNKSDETGQASFTVKASSHVELSYETGNIEIGPYASVTVPVQVKAKKTGKAEFQVEAHMGDESDRVVKPIPIRSRLTMADRVLVGRFEGTAELTAEMPPDMDDIPEDERDGMDVTLLVTDNPLVRLEAGLKYLLKYPYGCVEQTSSGVMSLAGLRSLVKEGRLPGINLEETDKFLEPGIEKILSMQLANHAFGYWPGSTSPHPWGTVYAVQALHLAKAAGVDVPLGRFDKALGYLANQADGMITAKKLTTTDALTLYVLAAEGKADEDLFGKLRKRMERFSREARVVFVLALLKAKKISLMKATGHFNKFMADLDDFANDDEFDYYTFRSASRELAFMLLMACELDKRDGAGAQLADRLLAKVGPHGRWTSTHDTGWCLLALAAYWQSVSPLKTVASIEILQGKASRTLLVEPGVSSSVELDGKLLASNPVIRLKTKSQSPLFYRLSYRVPMTEAERRRLEGGYEISRRYVLPGEVKRPIRVGDIVEVQVDVKVSRRGEYLVLEDPLPAGFVAINSKLKTEPALANKSDERSCYGWWEGWWAWVPQHMEMRDDRVLSFRNSIWREPYRYTYFVRAVVPGRFTAPSAKVQEMYRPECVGFCPAQTVVIEPQKEQ